MIADILALVRAGLADTQRRPWVLGICGAQGSGKSTLAAALVDHLAREGVTAVALSIDDLYRTKDDRERLAETVHPLLRTRGVPGTHDVELGLALIDRLARGEAAPVPRFDKARDDRAPEAEWPIAPCNVQILILEGWCVGAVAQDDAALGEPVNALERTDDADGRWRRFVNAALARDYPALFGRIDALLLLAAPHFGVVRGWRIEQEQALARRAGPDAPGVMSDAEVDRFIAHYERLTRHILAEMPARADLVVALASDRAVIEVRGAQRG